MSFIILDRDGVINFDSDFYIKSPAEWEPIPGSLAAIAQLNRAGFQVIVASNQSGIARGLYDVDMLHKIHEKFFHLLNDVGGKVTEIFFCPHHPDEGCLCRKPNPGMLQKIAEKYSLHLADIYFIGDSIADMRAAEQAGCKPILVLTGNGKKTIEKFPEVPHFENLADAVQVICKKVNHA
jgi:D-glycero-D-manno-heptose 1,7-bisphosphate phosphatase